MPTSLIDFLIGTNTAGLDQPNPVEPSQPIPAPAMTEVEWYRNMWTSGLIGFVQQKAQAEEGALPNKKAPGYVPPPPVMFGTNPSVESRLQEVTKELASTALIGNWSQSQVALLLSNAATDAAAWLDGQDSSASAIPMLVAKYVAVYNRAITPV